MADPFRLKQRLAERQQAQLYRQRLVLDSAQGARVRVAGRELLNFCSNDYLGLANHPRVVAAFQKAATTLGVGSGASHLVVGHGRIHHQLEDALAEFVGRPRALLFSSGFMANLGVIGTLVDRHDLVLQDKLNHASLLDGAQLGRGQLQRYRHLDVAHLQERLQAAQGRRTLVVTDAVFSMDGDIAPLPELAAACAQQAAWLMVDDAHGFGVLGREGRGTPDHFGLGMAQVPVYMATLGKALGGYGAFVAGSDDLVECLIQECRPYVYTTAIPPAVAAATLESLHLLQEESWRIGHLQALIRLFREEARQRGIPLAESFTAIQPLIAGSAARALRLSRHLRQQGILVSAIRPPTVPVNTARLRITLSADHTGTDIHQLLDALHLALSSPED